VAKVDASDQPARPPLIAAIVANAGVIAETLESLKDAAREARKAFRRAA